MAKAGLCTIANKTKSIFEMIDVASDCGADGIEIWGQPAHVNYPIAVDELKQVRIYASEKKVEICALGSYLRTGKKVEYNGIEITIQNQIEIARLLGSRIIRIWPGAQNFEEYSESEIELLIEEIRHCADQAGVAGICIVLERHCGTLLNGWDNVEEILNRINSENVFLNYQVVFPAPVLELQEKGKTDYKNLLKYSRHAHLQNYALGDDGKLFRTFLDSGVVDYSGLGGVAEVSGYADYFMVEFPAITNGDLSETEVIKRDIDFIKGI